MYMNMSLSLRPKFLNVDPVEEVAAAVTAASRFCSPPSTMLYRELDRETNDAPDEDMF